MDIGDTVPDFTLTDDEGVQRSLSELSGGGPLVVYFYPAAMTKGCTAESCHFRDLVSDFAALGAGVVGVSIDEVERLGRFRALHQFGFPLLSDPDATVARLFGVHRNIPFLPTKRWTFIIDSNRTVIGIIKSETKMNRHADEAMQILRDRLVPR